MQDRYNLDVETPEEVPVIFDKTISIFIVILIQNASRIKNCSGLVLMSVSALKKAD